MRKSFSNKIKFSLFVLVFICLICGTTVYAWFSFYVKEPMGEITAAEASFSTTITINGETQTKTNNENFTTEFNCANLAYLDLAYDVNNTNNVFNKMVSVISVNVENTGIVPLIIDTPETTIKLIASGNQVSTNGLIYMYVPLGEEETDYVTYLKSFLNENPTDADIRNAINEHNSDFFTDLIMENQNDSYGFQIILIGDYNNLSASEKANYLNYTFKVTLTLNINQFHD